ncbi:hypothetical protein PV325_014107, partial [Microctonus aethiopoides]
NIDHDKDNIKFGERSDVTLDNEMILNDFWPDLSLPLLPMENEKEYILENHECEDDDKYSSGSQYEPSDTEDSESSDDENHESGKMDKSRTTNNSYILRDISLILNASFNVPGSSACDDSNMKAQLSRGAKGDKKLNYCLYCQKPYTKITRHLES